MLRGPGPRAIPPRPLIAAASSPSASTLRLDARLPLLPSASSSFGVVAGVLLLGPSDPVLSHHPARPLIPHPTSWGDWIRLHLHCPRSDVGRVESDPGPPPTPPRQRDQRTGATEPVV